MNEAELKKQVQLYDELRPIYKIFAEILKDLLSRAVKRLAVEAIVQSRAKELPSFAEKAIQKEKEYPDPVNSMNDLCGARVIADRKDQIEPICDYIRQHFQIDEDHPDNVLERLGTNKFGYRARHFIVSLKPDEFIQELEELVTNKTTQAEQNEWRFAIHRICSECRIATEPVNSETVPVGVRFRAEIQVKTILEHAWASLAHDNQYKGDFTLPGRLSRDIYRVSAALEEADLDMVRTVSEIESYGSYYGRYMQPDALQEERMKFDLIFNLDRSNIEVAKRVARLALSAGDCDYAERTLFGFIGDWEKSMCSTPDGGKTNCGDALIDAIAVFEAGDHSDALERAAEQLRLLHDRRTAMLFLDYGRALGVRNPSMALDYLTRATKLDPNNLYAHVFLGEMYYNNGELENALTAYGKALDLAQSDPEALYGYICAKIESDHADGFVAALRSNIRHAITRCQDRASVGIYDPRVYCQLGLFFIFLEDPFASMSHFARAITLDKDLLTINKALEGINKLSSALHGARQELEWAKRLLAAAIEARKLIVAGDKKPPKNCLAAFKSPRSPEFRTPIMIVAGGCNKGVEETVQAYGPMLEVAFADFQGTVLAGGTQAGIAQLIGDLPDASTGPIYKLAYMPDFIPIADRDRIHKGYQLHKVQTRGYTPLLAIQVWVDILNAGISVSDVRLLGVNGGEMSAFEYRLALAMGAKVGVIRGSGRAADTILEDRDWKEANGLLGLPNDPQTIKLFVIGYRRSGVPMPEIEVMARKDHAISVPLREERISKEAIETSRREDPDNASWENLIPTLQDSICQRIEHMFEKLRAVGRQAVLKDSPEAQANKIDEPNPEEINFMAKMEHARYNLERLEKRFRLGKKKDWDAKTNPTLVPWCELSTKNKERDRVYVQQGIERLKEAGYVIIRAKRGP